MIGHKDEQVADKKISKLRLFLVIAVIVSIVASLFFFLIYPAVNRQIKERAFTDGIKNQENEELMSLRLFDMIELHYEKGNYNSVKPYIEETAALYSDGYAKLEALSQINVIFYNAKDWSSLRQFYEYLLSIAKENKLDEETIALYKGFLQEVKTYEQN